MTTRTPVPRGATTGATTRDKAPRVRPSGFNRKICPKTRVEVHRFTSFDELLHDRVWNDHVVLIRLRADKLESDSGLASLVQPPPFVEVFGAKPTFESDEDSSDKARDLLGVHISHQRSTTPCPC